MSKHTKGLPMSDHDDLTPSNYPRLPQYSPIPTEDLSASAKVGVVLTVAAIFAVSVLVAAIVLGGLSWVALAVWGAIIA